MPDESCRICGGGLGIHKSCPDCRKPTQKRCMRCNAVTQSQLHQYCMNESGRKPLLVPVVAAAPPSKARRSSVHLSLLAAGAIGIFVLGLVAAYSGDHQVVPDEAQATSINVIKVPSGFAAPNAKSYDNCLAYGSGESITVTCPTGDGSVYKGILNMPNDLKKEFGDSVFSIRGVSVTEDPDGSVMIGYHTGKYVTTYFGS